MLELSAELGDAVTRGQVLAQIEAQASEEAVRSARSALNSATKAALLAQRQAGRSASLVERGAQATAKLEVDRNAVSLAPGSDARGACAAHARRQGAANATAPAQIEHLNRKRVARVEANTAGRGRERDRAARLASAAAARISHQPGGDAADQNDVFSRILMALCAAVLLMYLVLEIQVGSFLDPLPIMASLPLSLIGVMLALLFRTPRST